MVKRVLDIPLLEKDDFVKEVEMNQDLKLRK